METQSGWAADTNLSARLQFHETFVDMNPANENYYISYFQLNIRLTLYLQHLQFSNMTAGIFRLWEKRVISEKRAKLCYPQSIPRWLGTVPTHRLTENAAPAASEAAGSQFWTSPVRFVNILDLFQHELNANPMIQLGQLLPPGHSLKQTCYVRTCFHLHVARKSRGIQERIFNPHLHPEFFVS